MNLKGSETEKNLVKAATGESLARNKYTYFAGVAKKEGYEQIAAIFLETADNEKEHAKVYYKKLINDGSHIEITAKYCDGLGTTLQNLEFAFLGENEENTILYPGFAEVAKSEGFIQIYDSFMQITEVEKHHEARYRKLHENVIKKAVFKKEIAVDWKCRNCGRVMNGPEAPEDCPACHHPRAYFELLCDNF